MNIHFVGIGGSGMSAVAGLAKEQGYDVTGCDLKADSAYVKDLKIYEGHNESHIDNVDLVVVSPAVFYQNNNHPEVLKAKNENKLITWQEFLGKYLQKEKQVVCVAGTHGKSTTTTLLSLVLEKAKIDINVMVGAIVKEWGKNYRYGKSKLFITEADEFYDNFLNYYPEAIILNNIEFDHPDYFKNEEQLYDSFRKFINKLVGKRILIYNKDDKGIQKLFNIIGEENLSNFNLHGYSIKDRKIDYLDDRTEFEFDNEKYVLKIPGKHNVSNAFGVLTFCKVYGIKTDAIKEVFKNFDGIGRRMDFIGEKNNAKVYDDYAHHPTAIRTTLAALRQKYKLLKILVIVEPHTFSRTKALLPLYKNAFTDANEVIIAPIFASRDTIDFGVSGEDIVKVSNHKKIKYLDSFDKIIDYVKKEKKWDVIIVMGAGDSSKLAKQILENL